MRIDVDTKAARALILGLARDLDERTADAINRTAHGARKALVEEMRRVFDRPTDWTLNSVRIQAASRTRLQAFVWLKDEMSSTKAGIPATKFLRAEIDGGARRIKRFELALQSHGYMPEGWVAVPGKFARLDAWGHISVGQIIQILSQLRVRMVSGSDRGKSFDKKRAAKSMDRQGGQIFALPKGRGKLLPGIYQRRDFAMGSAAPRPLLIFVPKSKYRPRLDWAGVAQGYVDEHLASNILEAVAGGRRAPAGGG